MIATLIRLPCAALQPGYAVSSQAKVPTTSSGPEDVLTVTVYNEPQLSGHFRVEKDGEFSYPFLGRVRAGGRTLAELADVIKARLADGYLRHPQVTVEVDQFRSQNVFVMGEVRTPGKYVLSGPVTLLDALARAGSTTDAAGAEVLILHPKDPDRGSADAARPAGCRGGHRQSS